MHKLASGAEPMPFQSFLAELIESSAAEYRLARLPASDDLPKPGRKRKGAS